MITLDKILRNTINWYEFKRDIDSLETFKL